MLVPSLSLARKYFLVLKEFLSPRTTGGVLTPEGLKGCTFSGQPERLYLCVSHALLSFYPLDLPPTLSGEKKIAAAKLEALRLHRLFTPSSSPLAISFCFGAAGRVWALVIEKDRLDSVLATLPPTALLSGLFPSWVALWVHFQPQVDGLYFVKTPWSYEGFVIRKGQITEFLPSSLSLGQTFLERFEGEVFEAQGDSVQILTEASQKITLVFPEAPTFEGYPLRIRPKVPKKILSLWLFPLLTFALSQGLVSYENRLEAHLSTLKKRLSQAEKAYRELQAKRQKYELTLRVQANVKPYFRDRPPLLKVLKVLTTTFPDESWIRRMEFRSPDEIRIWAEGKEALKILEKLNQSPLFTEARFGSSVTKNPATGKESFYLILKLKPTSP